MFLQQTSDEMTTTYVFRQTLSNLFYFIILCKLCYILFLMIETSRGGKCESNEWRHTGAPGIVLVTGRMWTGGGGIVSTKL